MYVQHAISQRYFDKKFQTYGILYIFFIGARYWCSFLHWKISPLYTSVFFQIINKCTPHFFHSSRRTGQEWQLRQRSLSSRSSSSPHLPLYFLCLLFDNIIKWLLRRKLLKKGFSQSVHFWNPGNMIRPSKNGGGQARETFRWSKVSRDIFV